MEQTEKYSLKKTSDHKAPLMVMERNKRRILILLILAILATVLVSASLSSMHLQAGSPFPGGDGAEGNSESLPDTYASEPVFRPASRGFLWVIPLLFLLFLLFLMFRQVETRRILFGILIFCLFIGLIAILFGDQQTMGSLLMPPQEASPDTYRVGPVGSAPTVFVWLAIGGFGVLAGVLGAWLVRTTFNAISTKNLIKEEAKNALKEIQDGREWSNVVVRCYLQMVRVLQAERGIERGDAMTTREFESVLVSHNFPEETVHRLTTLFEKVRYGNKRIDSKDEQTALECLTAIIGGKGERGDKAW